MTTLAPQKFGHGLTGRLDAVRHAWHREQERVLRIHPGFAGKKARARRRIRALGADIERAVLVEGWDGYIVLRGQLPTQELVRQVETAVAAAHSPRKIHNFIGIAS